MNQVETETYYVGDCTDGLCAGASEMKVRVSFSKRAIFWEF